MSAYLESLTVRLALAAAALPDDVRARHGQFLLSSQRDDGGFAGREGESDLYYTAFGLRALAILGQLDGHPAAQALSFLKSRIAGKESIVDFFSLIYGGYLLSSAIGKGPFDDASADWSQSVAEMLERLRCADGGYAKGLSGMASSVYHTFLVLLCQQLIDQPAPEPDRIVDFVRSQASEDGGFREIRVSKRAGTNPTAAAIATLKILGALDDELRDGTVDFLSDMQVDSGGLRANTRIPIADTLSTFTAVLTLLDLEAIDAIDRAQALSYVQSLEQEDGGFLGAEWDLVCDVEYTFYGVASLALLNHG